MFLQAEELERRRFRSFLQPISEHRHAYEHLIRTKANAYGLDEEPLDAAYQEKGMRRVLGHEYRAFFDCADWLSVILRERIQRDLRFFSPQCIHAGLPEYYNSYKLRIIEISGDIAAIRGQKDIARKQRNQPEQPLECGPEIIDEIEEYLHAIEELCDIHKKILAKMPALVEYRDKTIWREAKRWILTVLGGIAAAILAHWLLS